MSARAKQNRREKAERIRQEVDREEAFRAWLSKKKEKERAKKRESERVMEWEARMKQQKQERGKAAYEAWVQLKQEQSRAEQKEKHRQKEIEHFEAEKQKEHLRQSKETYDRWKEQKDFEMRLQKQTKDLGTQQLREPTPPVPGYCSVWSCDDDLAPFMLQRVQRPNSPFVLPDTYPPPQSS